jgi:hypothetical protein
MANKQLARVSQAVTVKCKQMVESGNLFCSSVLPEFDGNYVMMKQCQNVMHTAKNKHIAKFFTSTKVEPLTNTEVKEDDENTDVDNTEQSKPIKPVDPVIICVYVPIDLEDKLSAVNWFKSVTNVEPESLVLLDDGVFVYGMVYDEFPFKYQDLLVSNSYALVKKLGLYVDLEDDEPMYDFDDYNDYDNFDKDPNYID